MTSVLSFMLGGHEACDDLFVSVESAVAAGDWDRAEAQWARFESSMREHFAVEEEILFPEVERCSGMTEGPTQVMRMDHDQMRALLDSLASLVASRDQAGFLGQSETMMLMIQQHNMKEEQVLYPMADSVLDDVDSVVSALRERGEARTGVEDSEEIDLMASHFEVDVRELEAPEPLRKVLSVVEQLQEGQYVHVIHRREGRCLLQLIDELGFDHKIANGDPHYDIWIWRRNDNLAGLAVQEAAGG